MRVSLLSYRMPEMHGPTHGVFSKIPQHEPSYDKRYLTTTYYESYQRKFDETGFKPKDSKMYSNSNTFCGNESGFHKPDKIRITTKLISEKYNTGNEPKFNTAVQRTWINHKDGAIKAVSELNVDNTKELILPPIDNELSINLGKQNLETIKDKFLNGCPKRRTDISRTTVKVLNLRKY